MQFLLSNHTIYIKATVRNIRLSFNDATFVIMTNCVRTGTTKADSVKIRSQLM
jgi:hypothetical protein